MKEVIKGILSGLCISLGGSVFLACESKVAGAFFFSVALLTICMFGFSLYTGKIGYIVASHKGKDFANLGLCILGNLIGCVIFGLMVQIGVPPLAETAKTVCQTKLNEGVLQALIRGFFCGVLMYVAVWIFKSKKSIAGILICIPVFILSGFEHSVANMFYFACAGMFSLDVIFYIILIVIGNSAGSIFTAGLQKLADID